MVQQYVWGKTKNFSPKNKSILLLPCVGRKAMRTEEAPPGPIRMGRRIVRTLSFFFFFWP